MAGEDCATIGASGPSIADINQQILTRIKERFILINRLVPEPLSWYEPERKEAFWNSEAVH
jgi:hypothetical protein